MAGGLSCLLYNIVLSPSVLSITGYITWELNRGWRGFMWVGMSPSLRGPLCNLARSSLLLQWMVCILPSLCIIIVQLSVCQTAQLFLNIPQFAESKELVCVSERKREREGEWEIRAVFELSHDQRMPSLKSEFPLPWGKHLMCAHAHLHMCKILSSPHWLTFECPLGD